MADMDNLTNIIKEGNEYEFFYRDFKTVYDEN
jgi:hypothetical protein